ncbi:hypothetical protein HYE59_11125 [Aggregatibacter actinomycetemcomitans]|uniref:hypothetical protein n=1 Tax=Aggregatibacter actinomycetemcomitans TaxID=714 RepID=UPI00197C6A36|nr:hypothetical protein [Aggregatibacter actinomycetemcomitans]MBN6078055.1 hypothetical protein [Aggregatibacter actinomycetemcomitans]
MNKKAIIIILILFSIVGGIFGFNYFSLTKPLDNVLESDYRNKGVEISVHYENYVNPNVLVFDIRKIQLTNSVADVFRVFWQYTNELRTKSFDKIILSSKGQPKFYILGSHFNQLGKEYGIQNPVYIVRTFPEKVYNMNGTKAFNSWTGGMLGVTARQMDDFNDFARKWFIDDVLK